MRKDIEQPPEFSSNPLEARGDGMYSDVRRFNSADIKNAVAGVVGVTLLAACGIRSPISPTHSSSSDNSGAQTSTSREIGATPTPEAKATLPKTYNSVKDAFAAIQGVDGELGKCMKYTNWPGREDAWLQTALDFIANRPEIPYKPAESSGSYGPAAEYDGGYCMIMTIGTNSDAVDKNGALIYLAMGENGPEVDYVLFNGDPNGPIWPTDPGIGPRGN